MPASSLDVLVVDDERLARQHVQELLERESDVHIVGSASTGKEAIQQIRRLQAEDALDLVFLDIDMPGLSGLDVVREIGAEAMPVTIFVTAYNEHAVEAFELAALDYVLKPFEEERFRKTLDRARRTIRLEKVDAIQKRLLDLLQGGTVDPQIPSEDTDKSSTDSVEVESSTEGDYLKRIAVEMRGRIRVVPVEDIDYFEAEGNYVRLHAGEETHLIDDTMENLERSLAPESFARIHRSIIVQLNRVETLLTAEGGDYSVRLRDGTRLKVARGRRDDLVQRLGLDV